MKPVFFAFVLLCVVIGYLFGWNDCDRAKGKLLWQNLSGAVVAVACGMALGVWVFP